MNIKNLDIKKFNKKFTEEYNFLYDNNDNVAGEDEAIDAFDEFVKTHSEFVGEFVKYRGDFISSDREAAAFMFAFYDLIDEDEEEEKKMKTLELYTINEFEIETTSKKFVKGDFDTMDTDIEKARYFLDYPTARKTFKVLKPSYSVYGGGIIKVTYYELEKYIIDVEENDIDLNNIENINWDEELKYMSFDIESIESSDCEDIIFEYAHKDEIYALQTLYNYVGLSTTPLKDLKEKYFLESEDERGENYLICSDLKLAVALDGTLNPELIIDAKAYDNMFNNGGEDIENKDDYREYYFITKRKNPMVISKDYYGQTRILPKRSSFPKELNEASALEYLKGIKDDTLWVEYLLDLNDLDQFSVIDTERVEVIAKYVYNK